MSTGSGQGHTSSGSGYQNSTETDVYTKSTPVSGTWYSVSPNNTNYWWWTDSGSIWDGVISCYCKGTFKRGTSTFTLNTEVTKS